MKFSKIEKEVINISEKYYNKKTSLIKKVFFNRYKFKNIEIPTKKSFIELWKFYGLKNDKKHSFTENEKLNCITEWYFTLYSKKINFEDEYKRFENEFRKTMKETIKKEQNVHYNWNFPTVESFLNEVPLFRKEYK